jgi:hypothetical protein
MRRGRRRREGREDGDDGEERQSATFAFSRENPIKVEP